MILLAAGLFQSPPEALQLIERQRRPMSNIRREVPPAVLNKRLYIKKWPIEVALGLKPVPRRVYSKPIKIVGKKYKSQKEAAAEFGIPLSGAWCRVVPPPPAAIFRLRIAGSCLLPRRNFPATLIDPVIGSLLK